MILLIKIIFNNYNTSVLFSFVSIVCQLVLVVAYFAIHLGMGLLVVLVVVVSVVVVVMAVFVFNCLPVVPWDNTRSTSICCQFSAFRRVENTFPILICGVQISIHNITVCLATRTTTMTSSTIPTPILQQPKHLS